MKELKYELDFYQALKEMFENKKWIKGEHFKSSCYMKVNSTGNTVIVDTKTFSSEENMPIHLHMTYQKYAIVEFVTQLK